MDEVVCAWHSELISEEAKQALLSQDCFSGELTQTVLGQKLLRQQAQHVIGPHVTGRLQLTDTTFAAPGKQAGESAKCTLRRRLRQKAWLQRTAPKLRFGALELLQVATAMHADFQLQASKGVIVKALRAAHFLDFLPSPSGLCQVSQEDALLWPAGGHRIDADWSGPKSDWMQPVEDEAGRNFFKPLPTDWTKLNELRKEQAGKKSKTEAAAALEPDQHQP